ncbi:MAG: hypothetical protein LBG65_04450 [Puniceicoccales bacterium]|nr:hypothetical protein [Puniceicoccales bacterium]
MILTVIMSVGFSTGIWIVLAILKDFSLSSAGSFSRAFNIIKIVLAARAIVFLSTLEIGFDSS